jgi:hypothetical protein
MLTTGSSFIDAERAFSRAARARRRAALLQRVRRRCLECLRLAVYDDRGARPALPAIREIPLTAITGTLEPGRAKQFDRAWRPARDARLRWERLWLAESRGTVLPPISVVAIGDRYAIRDGHHRVSVARARGALTIDAIIEGFAPRIPR